MAAETPVTKRKERTDSGNQDHLWKGVIGALRERGLSQWDAAHAAGLSQGTLNSILQGNIALTPSAKAKIEAAIVELGLAEARVPDAREPVFSVPVKSDE